jgi:uncharacterized protein (TIGR00369 family)
VNKPGTDDYTRTLPLEETIDGTLGITYEQGDEGRIVGRMPVEPRVCQPYGIVHGGAYAVIAESMTSAATYMNVAEEGKIALGMSNQTQLLRPISQGHVNATAEAIHRGRSTWVWDVEMRDDEGNLCATSRIVVAVRPAG